MPKAIRYRSPKGRLIGWKKAYKDHRGVLIKLAIPASAHVICGNRWCATAKSKRRVSEAQVLAVFLIEYNSRSRGIQGKRLFRGPFRSKYDPEFLYRVGKKVVPHYFDDCKYESCAGGIHFFLSKTAALAW